MAELAPQLARPGRTGFTEISVGDLRQHRSRGDAWVAVDGVVYDATEFIGRHPGQSASILAHAGEDITPILNAFHSSRAREMLSQLPIVGRLKDKPDVESRRLAAEVQPDGSLCNFTVYDPAKKRVVNGVGRERRVPLPVHDIHEQFRAWVKSDETFPCIAGKIAVIGQGSYGLGTYDHPIGDPANSEALLQDLRAFIRMQSAEWAKGNRFTTFVAVFPASIGHDTWTDFVSRVPDALTHLQDADDASLEASSDQTRDFLIVSLHHEADRKSHRFAYPALVFNAKDQFKHLETTRQMAPIQNAVRRRDKRISGDELANPVLPQVTLRVPNGA